MPFLLKVGFTKDKIFFVPISGLQGINLDSAEDLPEELTSWYKDPVCLMDVIDNFKGARRPVYKPIRVCVYDFYTKVQDGKTNVHGDCLSVKIESGIIQEKDVLVLLPQGVDVVVRAIMCNNEAQSIAYAGQLCEISVELPKKFDKNYIRRGSVMCDKNFPIN